MDLQWMVITESLGVDEANRWRRARIEQMLGLAQAAGGPEPNPDACGTGIREWLVRSVTALVGRGVRRTALQAAAHA
jgi:hypothetical protein